MAFGKKTTVNDRVGSGLRTAPDGALEACTGNFPSGATFEFRTGLPFVKGVAANAFAPATPDEIREIEAALQAEFGSRNIKIEGSGRFILLNAPEPSPLEEAVRGAQKHLQKRVKTALGTYVKRAREAGMVTMARYELERFLEVEMARTLLKRYYSKETNLEDLIEVALKEAQSPESRKEMALEKGLLLAAHIAKQRKQGKNDAEIRTALECKLQYRQCSDGTCIERSNGEIQDIIDAAFAEANRVESSRPVDSKALIEKAYELGMVSVAMTYLYDLPALSVKEAIDFLIINFPGTDQLKQMANLAVLEAQTPQKIYWRAYRMLEADGAGAIVLAQRRAGTDAATIEADLKAEYAEYINPSGKKIKRGEVELQQICKAAIAHADVLERKEQVETTNTAENKWDALMRDRGAFRLARLRMEEGLDKEAIRPELETLFSGEDDPEAMAAYVLSRISNAKFNEAQAAQEVKQKAYDRAARTRVDAGEDDGHIEAALMVMVKTPNMSDAEAKDIVRMAIKQARAEVQWEADKEQGKNLLWKATKAGVLGAGALALTASALTIGAGAMAIKKLWGGTKKAFKAAAPYILPVGKALTLGAVGATVDTVKLARNTLIYAPLTAVWTPLKRTYQFFRAAKNYPEPPHYKTTRKWWKKPGRWFTDGARAALWRGEQTVALAGALAALPLVFPLGMVEGLAKGVGHEVLGTQWNGSKTADEFMHRYEESKQPKSSAEDETTTKTAAAKPAAGGAHN